MAEALRLTDVSLTLSAASGPVDILKGVNFSANKGESIAIVGPSGSGKSSMISVAAGLEQATSGDIFLLGESLKGRTEDELARLRRGRVSMVFQSFHLLPTMTAFDNVRAAALEAVGLSDRVHHYPGQLSGGERQRVAVARALASDPKLVFADEPTGNLDAATGAGVADMLFNLASDRGATLILVTHDLNLASRADRIVTMQGGILDLSGLPCVRHCCDCRRRICHRSLHARASRGSPNSSWW